MRRIVLGVFLVLMAMGWVYGLLLRIWRRQETV
jgi:p-aminobenzoyl-glutamate transporter AbgT